MADGASTRIDDELTRLRAEIGAREQEIREDVDRIVRLLGEDLPAYLDREVKGRFLAAVEFADAMPAATVADLKRAIGEEGRRAAAEITSGLRDDGLWLLDVEDPSAPLELRDVPAAWRRLARIDAVLEDVLTRYGFPPAVGGQRPEYRPPTWFVGGALLKTLLETYRAHLAERSRLRRAVEAREREQRRRALELKWDAAG